MNVLNVAYPFAPVRPATVGGAEHVLGVLDRALMSAGHRSLVAACEGSLPAGELFSLALPRGDRLDAIDRVWCRKQMQAAIDRALASTRVDLVHMHGLNFHEYVLPAHIPVLVTLHMPLSWYPADTWQKWKGRAHFQCVSASQLRTCPRDLNAADVSVIENGVELPPWSAADSGTPRENFALVLGRVCPEKNAHEAFAAGTAAGVPVRLGGEVFAFSSHQNYFAEKIQPQLAEQSGCVRHSFLGPLDPEELTRSLRSTRCLLHPTLAPETSSLVAMESLAHGTPVIAYRSGALPEIVEDGVTGFLVNNVDEMASAIRRVDTISRAACRATAEKRFCQSRMVANYLRLYRQLTNRGIRRYA